GRFVDRRPDGGRAGGVQDQALADERVEDALEAAHSRGRVGDVPDQEAVVETDERRPVVVHARRALQPPVRRVQGVGVVGPGHEEAGGAQTGRQLAGTVDAGGGALVVVVVVGQGRADARGAQAGRVHG